MPLSFKTPPQSRKRKAVEQIEDIAVQTKKSSKPSSISEKASTRFPTTPSTDVGTPPAAAMDSDDEIMSDGISSQEEEYGGTQDSDVGSLDDGTSIPIVTDIMILSRY